MYRRLIAIVIALLVLVALITASQYRRKPSHVSGFVEADVLIEQVETVREARNQ